jgi:putative ABC transport system substrate-binding protein
VNGAEDDPEMQKRIAAFRRGLGQLGWLAGHNIRIDPRYSAANQERLPQLAKELVALNPEVIFVYTTPATRALQNETRTIPIVFVNVSDPIGSGIIPNLARPGGNTTGFMLYEEGITGRIKAGAISLSIPSHLP